MAARGAQDGLLTDTTWPERFFMNLLSYSYILIPMATIILATRYRLLPAFLQSSAIVQMFVYGSEMVARSRSSGEDDSRLVMDKEERLGRRLDTRKDTRKSEVLTLLWCFFGLQISYLAWGILQEKIMTSKYTIGSNKTSDHNNRHSSRLNYDESTPTVISFHDSQFLVFINRIIAFIMSILALVHNRPKQSPLYRTSTYLGAQATSKPSAPLYIFIYCALSNILSSWCQYEALKYVDFPTQVLSKSCKIVPVMLMSKLMFRKRYQYFDYLCALILSLGMFIFLVYQPPTHESQSIESINKTSKNDQPDLATHHRLNQLSRQMRDSSLASGLVILSLYLTFDAFTSNWQQNLFTEFSVSNWQMMAATNFYSILLTVISLYQLGNLQPALRMLASSSSLMIDCLMMSIMSSVGQLFVYYTIRKFGSVTFAVIMTLRQFLAILLSCAIYGHRITLGSSCGLLVVFFVVGYQMRQKSTKISMIDSPDRTPRSGPMSLRS